MMPCGDEPRVDTTVSNLHGRHDGRGLVGPTSYYCPEGRMKIVDKVILAVEAAYANSRENH